MGKLNLIVILILSPIFFVFGQQPGGDSNLDLKPVSDIYFYLQFVITIALGLAIPLGIANYSWNKTKPPKYGSLALIVYMFPSLVGVFFALLVINIFGLFNLSVPIEDSPAALIRIYGFLSGFLFLFPIYIFSMGILFYLKRKRWTDAEVKAPPVGKN